MLIAEFCGETWNCVYVKSWKSYDTHTDNRIRRWREQESSYSSSFLFCEVPVPVCIYFFSSKLLFVCQLHCLNAQRTKERKSISCNPINGCRMKKRRNRKQTKQTNKMFYILCGCVYYSLYTPFLCYSIVIRFSFAWNIYVAVQNMCFFFTLFL